MTKNKIFLVTYSGLILILSYFVFFKNYDVPDKSLWDEIYTVASAYRYINNNPYPEFHPPLGIGLIALGETILNPNADVDTSGLGRISVIREFPEGFSFKGVRFFPVLLGSLSPLLFFLLLYNTVKNVHLAGLFSGFYLFENSIIVHTRTANFPPMEYFFMLICLLVFTRMIKKRSFSIYSYLLLGAAVGVTMLIRSSGALLILLIIAAALVHFNTEKSWKKPIKGTGFAIASLSIFIAFSFMVNSYHLMAALRGPDPDYRMAEYFAANHSLNITELRRMSLIMPEEDEYSTSPFKWPFGYKSIVYAVNSSPDSGKFVIFHGNPAIWLISLAVLFISFAIFISHYLWDRTPDIESNGTLFFIRVYVFLYTVYMWFFISMDRAVYITYYHIPLIFSFLLAYLIFFHFFGKKVKEKNLIVHISVILFFFNFFAVYLFFSPISYYREITYREFVRRDWFRSWDLTYEVER